MFGNYKNYTTYLMDYGGTPFVSNIKEITNSNTSSKTNLWTGNHLQVTLMSIPTGETIGLSVHQDMDQFIQIVSGYGVIQMGDNKNYLNFQRKVDSNYNIIIPARKWYNLYNTGDIPLKLYIIYAPSR